MDTSLIFKDATKKNKVNNIITFITIIPVISSALCAIYVVLMYSDVKILINDFKTINSIINNINTTKIDGLVNGIISLEHCALTKLPICS